MDEILRWYAEHRWALIPTAYAVASLATYVLYALDKRAARRGAWRTSEATLHLFELLGGWPGALAAQRSLHHKCSKASYQAEFRAIVFLNLAGLAYLVYGMCSGDWPLRALRAALP